MLDIEERNKNVSFAHLFHENSFDLLYPFNAISVLSCGFNNNNFNAEAISHGSTGLK